jgi:hypothetical protein
MLETKDLKIWKNLDIEKKGKITIGKDEEIFESIIYPFKFEEGFMKIISKRNIKTNEITFLLTNDNLLTEKIKGNLKDYKDFIDKFEKDLKEIIDISRKRILTKIDIEIQLNEL